MEVNRFHTVNDMSTVGSRRGLLAAPEIVAAKTNWHRVQF